MYLKKYHSPIGDLYMRSDGSVITGLWFINVQDEQHDSIEATKISIPIFEKMTQWLDLYFSGKSRILCLIIALRTVPFFVIK